MVLARLIERGPEGMTESQVIDGMTTSAEAPGRVPAVREAIGGLVEAGLLFRVGDSLRPTPAALRSGELELGL